MRSRASPRRSLDEPLPTGTWTSRQSAIPTTNWMFPVNPAAEVPEAFDSLIRPEPTLAFPAEEASANRKAWKGISWQHGISRATANRRFEYGLAVIVWRLNGKAVPRKRSMAFVIQRTG